MAPAATVPLVTLAVHMPSDAKVQQVWAWNLDREFGALLAAAAGEAGAGGAILALDMEFPGFLRQEPRQGARAVRYQALRENVDRLRPIQLGAAVAGADGLLRGAWSFNLRFDVDVDLHTAESVAFLRNAGIDFPRHAVEGIEAATLGRRLAGSVLVGQHGRAPWWITFSGSYDLGYLLKLLTSNRPLPRDFGAFDIALSTFCPRRHELRDELPYGSLDNLARKHGVQRHGRAHTAGSDALLTLELFLRVVGAKGGTIGRAGESRWTSLWLAEDGSSGGTNSGWEGQWYQGWDNSWDSAKWEASAWGFPFLSSTAPSVPWFSSAPVVPSLAGGAPMQSAAFWGAAVQGAMKLQPVAPVDASTAMRKMGWWMPDSSKVMEI